MKLTTERLQEIKKGDWLLHGTEEWTNQRDTDTEAVILELIAAYETSQQQLAEAEAEVTRLGNLTDFRDKECPKCGDQTWLTVTANSNLRCDYCEYEYDGKGTP